MKAEGFRVISEAFLAKHSIVDEVLAPILQREFRKELLSAACREEEEVHGRRIETDVDTSDEEGLCMTSHNPSTVSLTFPSSLGQAGGGISEAMKRSALIYLVSIASSAHERYRLSLNA